MTDKPELDTRDAAVCDALMRDDLGQLRRFAAEWDDFPCGRDASGHAWLRHAIDLGTPASVRWMLDQGADVAFRDADGSCALNCALDREALQRYPLLELLLEAGAPLDARGPNDYTPLHAAAVSEDIDALRMLLAHGADPTLRTRIDCHAAAVEEAWYFRRMKSVEFLESAHPLRGADWAKRKLR